jgi:type I restriction enzyme S subunit
MIVKNNTITANWQDTDLTGPIRERGIETRRKIQTLACEKDHLVDLTLGGLSGMYHVGQDKIVWAQDGFHGMPFLRSSDILDADITESLFISRKQVAGNSLFQCPAGTTLITRSGTIGRMTYMRPDMTDTAISQDVLKVVPDTSKVNAGYLYAFLKSSVWPPKVTGGTFGFNYCYIEAENIADYWIPRHVAVEDQAHELNQRARRSGEILGTP